MSTFTRRSVNGNVIYKRIYDSLTLKDDNGIYTKFIEYFDRYDKKFIEITLQDKDENDNYIKAKYERYDTSDIIVETKIITLVYDGNVLININDYIINNDFFSNERLKF